MGELGTRSGGSTRPCAGDLAGLDNSQSDAFLIGSTGPSTLSDPPHEGVADLALLDQMPAGLAIYDVDGVMLHSNPHFTRLVSCTDLPSGLGRGERRWQGTTPDGRDLDPGDFPCRRALRGETVSPGVDLVHFGYDGIGRWLNVSAAPIVDPALETIVGLVLLILDTNETAQATAFAARAGRRFRQFAENSGNAIWIADAATLDFTYRNPGHLALADDDDHGVTRLADWLDRIDDEDRAAVRHHYDRVLAGMTERFEYRLAGRDGERFRRMRETSFPIRDDNGQITMIGGISEDIAVADRTVVYLIGEDGDSTRALIRLIDKSGNRVKAFTSVRALLDVAWYLAPGCVVVDLASTRDAEANLARALVEHAGKLPTVIIGGSETPVLVAISAMRFGAADYLLSPIGEGALAEALDRASSRILPAPAGGTTAGGGENRIAALSKREREVLVGLTRGGTNKSIARDLGISPRTVEHHRSHLMERMNVRTLAGLLQAAHVLAGEAEPLELVLRSGRSSEQAARPDPW